MCVFKTNQTLPIYKVSNVLTHLFFFFRECLRFCFTRMIQNELDVVKQMHNNHHIRPYANQECPSGRPNIMYDFPYAYGKMFEYFDLL